MGTATWKHRTLCCIALALFALAASCGETRSSRSAAAANADTVHALRRKMTEVDDSLAKLIGQLDTGSARLASLDSARATLEVRAARTGAVNERLAVDAPDVFARLGSFVAEHKRLATQIEAMGDTISRLRQRVRRLEARNSDLRGQVAALREENGQLRSVVSRLLEDSVLRARKLAEIDSSRTAILNRSSRAWVAIASRDSLSRLGIAGKTNFLRLGPTVLRKFDTSVFRLVDTRVDTMFAIAQPPKGIQILSTHPSGSYVLIDEGHSARLRVIDVDAFWSISRTLAVMTDR